MRTSILAAIATKLSGYHYGYMRYQGKRPSIYWVGEYSTSSHAFESGHDRDEFILTGTSEGTSKSLETEKEAIVRLLDNYRYTDKTGGFVINFTRALNIPTETENIKRVELHFEIDSFMET